MANPVDLTHCCSCMANRYGHNCKCLVCGSTNVNHSHVYTCEVCGREYYNEDSADDCCPPEDEEEQSDDQ